MDLNSVSALFNRIDEPEVRESLMELMQGYLRQVASINVEASLKQKVGTSDIVQQSFLRVIEHFEQFNGESTQQFKAWLKQIVIHEISKARRGYFTEKRDVNREKSLDAGYGAWAVHDKLKTPQTNAIDLERIEIFHKVLKKLSPDDATVIQLRSIEGLPFKEIAAQMERTEESTAKLWYRAVLRFEEKLKVEMG